MNCVASPTSLFVCGSTALRPRALRPQLKRDPLGSALTQTYDVFTRTYTRRAFRSSTTAGASSHLARRTAATSTGVGRLPGSRPVAIPALPRRLPLGWCGDPRARHMAHPPASSDRDGRPDRDCASVLLLPTTPQGAGCPGLCRLAAGWG